MVTDLLSWRIKGSGFNYFNYLLELNPGVTNQDLVLRSKGHLCSFLRNIHEIEFLRLSHLDYYLYDILPADKAVLACFQWNELYLKQPGKNYVWHNLVAYLSNIRQKLLFFFLVQRNPHSFPEAVALLLNAEVDNPTYTIQESHNSFAQS